MSTHLTYLPNLSKIPNLPIYPPDLPTYLTCLPIYPIYPTQKACVHEDQPDATKKPDYHPTCYDPNWIAKSMGPYFPSIKYYLCDTSKPEGDAERLVPFGVNKFTKPQMDVDGTLIDPIADEQEEAILEAEADGEPVPAAPAKEEEKP